VRQQQTQQVCLVTVLLAEPRLEFGLDKQELRTACGRLCGMGGRCVRLCGSCALCSLVHIWYGSGVREQSRGLRMIYKKPTKKMRPKVKVVCKVRKGNADTVSARGSGQWVPGLGVLALGWWPKWRSLGPGGTRPPCFRSNCGCVLCAGTKDSCCLLQRAPPRSAWRMSKNTTNQHRYIICAAIVAHQPSDSP
jgi:hypothetical protein